MAKKAVKDGEEKEGQEKRQVRLTFGVHAKNLKMEAPALGASIRLEIDQGEEMSEKEFLGFIEKYRNGATA